MDDLRRDHPKAKKPPMTNQTTDAASAIRKGVRDGRCCSANINPPIEGTSSLAGVARRRWGGGPAGRVRVNWCGGVLRAASDGVSVNSTGRLGFVHLVGSLGSLLSGSSRLGSTISSRLRCSALSRSAREVRLGSSGLRSRSASPDFPSRRSGQDPRASGPWPPAAHTALFACSCAITRSSQPTKTHERTCARSPPQTRHAAARSVKAGKPSFPDLDHPEGPPTHFPLSFIVNEFLGLKKA